VGIAKRECVSSRYVRRLLQLAFLAPEIVQAIATGDQPPTLTAEALAADRSLSALDRARRSCGARLVGQARPPKSIPSRVRNGWNRFTSKQRAWPRLAYEPPTVAFSGAAHHANEAAGAGYFANSNGESAETRLPGGPEDVNSTLLPTSLTSSASPIRARKR
jgi:hypothetical protein